MEYVICTLISMMLIPLGLYITMYFYESNEFLPMIFSVFGVITFASGIFLCIYGTWGVGLILLPLMYIAYEKYIKNRKRKV